MLLARRALMSGTPKRAPLKILIQALDKERFSYAGKYYQINDCHIAPRPTREAALALFRGLTTPFLSDAITQRQARLVWTPSLARAICKGDGVKRT
jgi:hypothetical protein